MSQKIIQELNNLVDRELSEYYYYNKRKRRFWHGRSDTISCRVRRKEDRNKAKDMAINIRVFLLDVDETFVNEMVNVARRLLDEDREEMRRYIYSRYPDVSKDELDAKMGILIANLPDEEKRTGLNLPLVVSCRLLGYEKEFFFLKCYKLGVLPGFILRILYHAVYEHETFKNYLEDISEELELKDPYKGLDFDLYLNKISFS